MEQAALAALVMVVSIVIMLALGFPIGLSIGAGAAAAGMVVLPFEQAMMTAAKRTTADWCADAVKMCQVLDRRLKSERGIDAAGELKLLLIALGARRQ